MKSNAALGAENTKKEYILFISNAHESFRECSEIERGRFRNCGAQEAQEDKKKK